MRLALGNPSWGIQPCVCICKYPYFYHKVYLDLVSSAQQDSLHSVSTMQRDIGFLHPESVSSLHQPGEPNSSFHL